jgi:hypothetical protein
LVVLRQRNLLQRDFVFLEVEILRRGDFSHGAEAKWDMNVKVLGGGSRCSDEENGMGWIKPPLHIRV